MSGDFSAVFGSILGIILAVVRYVGIAFAVWGGIQFVLSMKDDNADGQSRALRLTIVGIALVAAPSLLNVLIRSMNGTVA